MYALVSLWQLDDARYEEQQAGLRERIIPFVRQSPGFVEGYWTYNRSNGKSAGFTVLDTAEHAHDLKNAVESQAEDQHDAGVQLELIWIQEIMAHVKGESGVAAGA